LAIETIDSPRTASSAEAASSLAMASVSFMGFC
jgi:hypothetical protein